MVLGTEDHPDLVVAKSTQMAEGLFGGNRVIGRDLGKGQVLARGVDEHDRHCALMKQAVMLVRRIGFGKVAAGEDHPGGVLVEEHRDVLGLGQPIRATGA